MFAAASIAVLIAILLYVIRALLGPTAFDRILAMNAMGTKTVILDESAGMGRWR